MSAPYRDNRGRHGFLAGRSHEVVRSCDDSAADSVERCCQRQHSRCQHLPKNQGCLGVSDDFFDRHVGRGLDEVRAVVAEVNDRVFGGDAIDTR
jgi:hypothetical protein